MDTERSSQSHKPTPTKNLSEDAAEVCKKRTRRLKPSCYHCRQRKVRCDGKDNQPCTRCKLANKECRYMNEQRRRGPGLNKQYIRTLESRLQYLEGLLQDYVENKEQDYTDSEKSFHHHQRESSVETDFARTVDENPAEGPLTSTSSPVVAANNEYDLMEKHMEKLTINDYQHTRFYGPSIGAKFFNIGLFGTNKVYRPPNEPHTIVQKVNKDEEEHVLLKSNNSTTVKDGTQISRLDLFGDIPHITEEFSNHLVHIYFTRSHQFIPVINKVQFLEQYYSPHSPLPNKYLIYAVVRIGIRIWKNSSDRTRDFGFSKEQLEQIEEALEKNVYKILNIMHECVSISTVQVLVLLSVFPRASYDDTDEPRYWLITGATIRMAQYLGLHIDCSKWLLPDYEIELRKRIWHAAYVIDRRVAIEMGRPVSIADNESNMQLPSPYELNYTSSFYQDRNDIKPVLIAEAERTSKEKVPVYSAFVKEITLSQITGQVINGFYTTRSRQTNVVEMALIDIIESSLANWKVSLPLELQVDTKKPLNNLTLEAIAVNTAHRCALILLYRPFIDRNDIVENAQLACKSLSTCTSAATDIVALMESLNQEVFVSSPWGMFAYALLQASTIFLYIVRDGNSALREQSIEYINRITNLLVSDPHLRRIRPVLCLKAFLKELDTIMDNTVDDESVSLNQNQANQQQHKRGNSNLSNDNVSKYLYNEFTKENGIQMQQQHLRFPLPQGNNGPDTGYYQNKKISSRDNRINSTEMQISESGLDDLYYRYFPNLLDTNPFMMPQQEEEITIHRSYNTILDVNAINNNETVSKKPDQNDVQASVSPVLCPFSGKPISAYLPQQGVDSLNYVSTAVMHASSTVAPEQRDTNSSDSY